MKTLALTTALVIGFAAPSLAASQLEKLNGVEAGTYSVSELAQLSHKATQTGNDGRTFLASDVATRGAAGGDIFEGARVHANASDDGLERNRIVSGNTSGSSELIADIQARVMAEIDGNF